MKIIVPAKPLFTCSNLQVFFIKWKLMKYTKPALSVEKQIELLKSRRLIINDLDYANRILNNITYYRLSSYMKYFQEDGTFKPSNIFEKELSRLFSKHNKCPINYRKYLTFHKTHPSYLQPVLLCF